MLPALRARPAGSRRTLPGAALAALALSLLAAGPLAAETTLERIKRTDTLRVGIADEPPYGYLDRDGQVTGEAPAIAREIFSQIDPDVVLEGVVVQFGELIPALQDGRIDMIAAGMYVTPERCRRIAFSTPTYKVGEAFAVRRGNPMGLTDFQDVAENRQAKVGVMAGAVEYNYAYAAGVPGDRALLFPNYDRALSALRRGEVDAVAMTALTVRALIERRNLTEVESTPQFFPEIDGDEIAGYGAFGFRKADGELIEAFDGRLREFVGTQAHWETVRAFGFRPDMAPDKSTETLCAR
jgi:polar amino acid transport system substrate-binding protein